MIRSLFSGASGALVLATVMCVGSVQAAPEMVSTLSGGPLPPAAKVQKARDTAPPPTWLEKACEAHAPVSPLRAVRPEDEAEQSRDVVPLSARFAAIDAGARDGTQVAVEPLGALTPEQSKRCAQFEALWNSGQHEAAVEELRALEKDNVPLAIGMDGSMSPAGSRWADRRIGDPRDNGVQAIVDADPVSGSLYVVVRWQDAWTVNRSTDHGETWTETYTWSTSYSISGVDAVVVDGYLYVAYIAAPEVHQGRLRRMHAATGSSDGASNQC